MSFDGYLSQDELNAAFTALSELGLGGHDAQNTLLGEINSRPYVNSLSYTANAALRLRAMLNTLNREPNLRTGEVPLAKVLAGAVALAGDQAAGDVLDDLLRKVRSGGVEPPPAPAFASGANHHTTPEAQAGAMDETLGVGYLRDGLAASRSVVKVLVHRHMNGAPEFVEGDRKRLVNGTGWLIGKRLLITNHHVIAARRLIAPPEPVASEIDFQLQAENTTLVYDYVDGAASSVEIPLGSGTLVCADKALDFAILRLPDTAPERPPLRLRAHAIRKTLVQALGTKVNILQHPLGNPMRLGFRNNYVVLGDDDTLSYLTDTEVGSSGSPVFDDAWLVGALHAGSRRISGAPIEIIGHRYRQENHGVPVAAILNHLRDHRSDVLAEIDADRPTDGGS